MTSLKSLTILDTCLAQHRAIHLASGFFPLVLGNGIAKRWGNCLTRDEPVAMPKPSNHAQHVQPW